MVSSRNRGQDRGPRGSGLVLVAEDGTGLDGFIEVVGVDEGLAFDLQEGDFSLLGEAVEGGHTYVEKLAGFFTGVETALLDGCRRRGEFGEGFGDDGLEEVFEGFPDHIGG